MLRSGVLVAIVSLITLAFVPVDVHADGNPWNVSPFTAEPTALLEAAKRVPVPEGVDAVVLRAEKHVEIDQDGRVVSTDYHVIRVLTSTAIRGFGALEAEWRAWHQARPTLRGRVITGNGSVQALDPGVLMDAPARRDIPEIYSDARVYGGPLPAVAPGAIIEVERTWRDTAPAFGTTVYQRISFAYGTSVRVLRMRVVVDVAQGLPFKYVVRHVPAAVVLREEQPSRVRWTFEAGPIDGPEVQAWTPFDVSQWPHVAFTTGASWSDIATRYGEIVDRQIRAGDMARLPALPSATGSAPRDIATRLLQRLQRDVRYTGVWLGNAAIVPRIPSEVLARGFGDCKDQTTLLVAMLRRSGVPAHVALLTAAWPEDPEPTLPALGVFDHAIVFVPGDPPLWIDPADRAARVGELPTADQGRLALVAASDTTQLVRIRDSSAADNREISTRQVFLDRFGPGRVVETVESYGLPAQFFRSTFQGDRTNARHHFERYVKGTYLAKDLGHLRLPEEADDVPTLRIEGLRAGRVVTEVAEAAVAIAFNDIVVDMPEPLLQETPGKPRTLDFLLPFAFTREWRYRIAIPDGFQLRELPAAETRKMGPVTFSHEFRHEGDAVVGVLRFDSGPRRIPATDVEALRSGLVSLRQAPPIVVFFDQRGEHLLSQGRAKEALAEFRVLADRYPRSGLERMRVARALLGAGLGEAAHAEATRAVELEPQSAVVQRLLGSVLEADAFGRPFGRGFDLPGAEAAYRRALQIDPDDVAARAGLAILLEHDEGGLRYSGASRLAQAIEEYRRAGRGLDATPMADNLAIALMRAGRYPEMKDALQAQGRRSPRWATLRLVALANVDGSAAAIRESASLIEDVTQRREALAAAAMILVQLRSYALAANLTDAAAQGAPHAAMRLAGAAWLRQIRRHEQLALPEDDPRSAVPRFITHVLVTDPRRVGDELRALTSRHMGVGSTAQRALGLQLRSLRAARAALGLGGVSPDVVGDIIAAGLRLTVEGEKDFGYRIRVGFDFPRIPTGAADRLFVFVVWEDGRYRLLGVDDALVGVARLARHRIEAGDLAVGARWLDWISDSLPANSDAARRLALFWMRGSAPDRDVMLDATAAVASLEPDDAESLERLRERLAQVATDGERARFQLVLAESLLARGRPLEALSYGQAVLAKSPESSTAFGLVCKALIESGRDGECRAVTAERLQRVPNDAAAVRTLARVEALGGRHEEADRARRQLIDLGRAGAAEWNDLAWGALFRPPVTEQALRDSQESIRMRPTPGSLHTLAMLYAEFGRIREARDVMWQGIAFTGTEEHDSEWWLIVGRIAEVLDAPDAAVAAYSKVRECRPYPDASSSYALAQNGLARLKGR